MHQLSGLDAAFLAMETSAVYGHVGSLCVLDPSTAPEPLTLERVPSHAQIRAESPSNRCRVSLEAAPTHP